MLNNKNKQRMSTPTGRLTREVAKGAQVRLPTVEITLVEPPPPGGPRANMKVAFWQRIVMQPRPWDAGDGWDRRLL